MSQLTFVIMLIVFSYQGSKQHNFNLLLCCRSGVTIDTKSLQTLRVIMKLAWSISLKFLLSEDAIAYYVYLMLTLFTLF